MSSVISAPPNDVPLSQNMSVTECSAHILPPGNTPADIARLADIVKFTDDIQLAPQLPNDATCETWRYQVELDICSRATDPEAVRK